MKLLKKIASIFTSKKTSEDMNEQRYASLMENLRGRKFQWIRPDNASLIAKVVRCRDIQPYAGGERFMVFFDDGSKVDSTKIGTHLNMISDESEILSVDQVTSIHAHLGKAPIPSARSTEPGPISIPGELKEFQSTPSSPKDGPRGPHPRPEPLPKQSVNMFTMFNSEPSDIDIRLTVKIPDKKLLKLMYSSADDKEKFKSELAEYLISMINKQVIMSSVEDMLSVPKPKVKKSPQPGGVVTVKPRND